MFFEFVSVLLIFNEFCLCNLTMNLGHFNRLCEIM